MQDPPLRACWMKVGQQKRVPATQMGSKHKWHLFGGYNWFRDTITWSTAAVKNTTTFIEFLEVLLIRHYPTGRVILVMDNVAYHKSAPALAALNLFEHRVRVIWLPPYCSDLNPIERFWRFLKDLACANHLEETMEAVVTKAEKVLIHQNDLAYAYRFHVSKDLR
jgi:DDE superfamily endonuclease